MGSHANSTGACGLLKERWPLPMQIFGISVNWQFKLVWLCIQSVVTCGTTPEHQSSDNWTSPNVR